MTRSPGTTKPHSTTTPLRSSPLELRQTVVHSGEPGETGPLYTRLLATDPVGPHHGAMFLTAEVYRDLDDGLPAFPIYRSLDGGLSWSCLAQVRDTGLRLGHRHQPMLYELREPFAGLPVGTILLAGNAVPADMSSTHLVLYSSVDGALTWTFQGVIDEGGAAVCDASEGSTTTSVWEPDLALVGDTLVCVFADERHKLEGMHQVISRRTSTDLEHWSAAEVIKGVPDQLSRPGMFVSTGRLPGGRHAAVIEIVGRPGVPVTWLSSPDGLDWGDVDDLGPTLRSATGVVLMATPNVHWRAEESGAVTVIVTGRSGVRPDGTLANVALVNHDGGLGEWTELELPVAASRELLGDDSGYSQSLTWNPRGELVQATTVRNAHGSNDIVVSVILTAA